MATFPADDKELTLDARQVSGGVDRGWILPWSLILVMLLGLAFEWFYSPVEKGLGEYMAWSRTVRPEAGRGWELNREGAEAMRQLGEMAETTRMRQSAGANLAEWSQIPALLDSFQVFSISPERFLNLYGQLPPALQRLVVDPLQLLRVRSGGRWQRVFFMRERQQQYVYLVDAYNVVLLQGRLDDRFYEGYDRFSRPLAATLSDLQRYSQVVPAEAFFQALKPSGPVELSPVDVEWITSLEGRLLRVGLANTPVDGTWEMGFEVERNGRLFVHRYWIDESIGQVLENELEEYREQMSEREAL